jgi:Family of unknown function (DUF5678)
MTSLSEGLPPEVAALIDPRWRENERAYWTARDSLLAEHGGQWVAFADGEVIASGVRPVEVLHAGQSSGRHPFIIRVGAEGESCPMRRASFPYDSAYPGEPLPLLSAEFRVTVGLPGLTLDRVIPDTGADASALPWADCQAIGLDPSMGIPGRMGGVGGSSSATLAFRSWVRLDGRDCPCWLQADFSGRERILGRDVLNRFEVLFRGPAGLVVVNP